MRLIAILLSLFIVGCGSTVQTEYAARDTGVDVIPPDTWVSPFKYDFELSVSIPPTNIITETAVGHGTLPYPPPPYGGERGDVVADREFFTYSHPDDYCASYTDPNQHKLDFFAPLWSRHLKSYYLGHPGCTMRKRKVLWLSVLASWFHPGSWVDASIAQSLIDEDQLGEQVAVAHILIGTLKKYYPYHPAQSAFMMQWIEWHNLTHPVLLDALDTFRTSLGRQDFFHVFILVETMQICGYSVLGKPAATIEELNNCLQLAL